MADEKTCDNCRNNLIPRQVGTCETCFPRPLNWEPKSCESCKHRVNDYFEPPCDDCTSDDTCSKWEPAPLMPETKDEQKICPLLMIGQFIQTKNYALEEAYCWGKRCAWWNEILVCCGATNRLSRD